MSPDFRAQLSLRDISQAGDELESWIRRGCMIRDGDRNNLMLYLYYEAIGEERKTFFVVEGVLRQWQKFKYKYITFEEALKSYEREYKYTAIGIAKKALGID